MVSSMISKMEKDKIPEYNRICGGQIAAFKALEGQRSSIVALFEVCN